MIFLSWIVCLQGLQQPKIILIIFGNNIRHSTSQQQAAWQQAEAAAWLFVCCWPWLLAVLSAESMAESIIEIELSRWDFNLSLVLRSLSVSQQTTLSADESPSFFPEFFHRFFYNSMKKWTNVELSNCRNKKHGWIEEKIISHRQEKKIQKKTIIRRSFKDSSMKQKWRQMRKISIQD